jgi:hypothetical protein
MLVGREIKAWLGDCSITIKATRGCPQGGVLSPLLWSLVIDSLLWELDKLGYEVLGFADDLVVMVRGKDDKTISNRLQNALQYINNWCRGHNLCVNPTKTIIVPFTRRRKTEFHTLYIEGVEVKLSNEVKYLGVILDKRLTWAQHISNLKVKATNAFMASKSLFNQRWGLKPNMVMWLYQTVIKPMVTYGSLLWWNRAQQGNNKSILAQIQRMACVAISGALRTAPTVALEAMLDLLPLHLQIKKEAAKEACRLMKIYTYLPGDLTGHMEILKEFQGLASLHKLSDVISETNFDLPFEVIIPERQEWGLNQPATTVNTLVYYTDGSKMNDRVGIGICGPSFRFYKSLGSTPSIFQAEVHAIQICANRCLHRKDLGGKTIYIMSDRQAALMAISSNRINSKTVLDCIDTLKLLSISCRVKLMWIPGHEGFEGNEIADKLAKQGSEMEFIGPEPYSCFEACNFKEWLNKWESGCKDNHWYSLNPQSQSRRFINYSKSKTKILLKMSRIELSVYTGLMTGHCPTRGYLTRIKKAHDDTCRLCLEHPETAEHLLCECEAVARARQNLLGHSFPTINDLKLVKPNKIVGFIRNLNLEGFY